MDVRRLSPKERGSIDGLAGRSGPFRISSLEMVDQIFPTWNRMASWLREAARYLVAADTRTEILGGRSSLILNRCSPPTWRIPQREARRNGGGSPRARGRVSRGHAPGRRLLTGALFRRCVAHRRRKTGVRIPGIFAAFQPRAAPVDERQDGPALEHGSNGRTSGSVPGRPTGAEVHRLHRSDGFPLRVVPRRPLDPRDTIARRVSPDELLITYFPRAINLSPPPPVFLQCRIANAAPPDRRIGPVSRAHPDRRA
jgi:hypothetical protein